MTSPSGNLWVRVATSVEGFITGLESDKNDSSQIKYKTVKGKYTKMGERLEKVNWEQDTEHLEEERTSRTHMME